MENLVHQNASSVEKALGILLAFASENREMGTTEISQNTGLPKSTASRLIGILVSADFLIRNEETRRFTLGRSALRMASAAAKVLDSRLLAVARPLLKQLARETGESIALEILTGIDVVLAMHVEGPGHLRFNFQQGEIVPINVAAGAKAILSHQEEDIVDAFLRRTFEKFNEKTITSKKEYLDVLSTARQEGVAYDLGERYSDIHAMAAPILPPAGQPTAAVIIAGPASRMTESLISSARKPLLDTVEAIAESLFSNKD